MRRLIYFEADWCAACGLYERELLQYLEKHAGKGQIVRIDVDKEPALSAYYQVEQIPTIVLQDGQIVVYNGAASLDRVRTLRWLRGGGDGQGPT